MVRIILACFIFRFLFIIFDECIDQFKFSFLIDSFPIEMHHSMSPYVYIMGRARGCSSYSSSASVSCKTPIDRSEHAAHYLAHHTRMVDDKLFWKMDRAIEEALPCAFGKRKSHF